MFWTVPWKRLPTKELWWLKVPLRKTYKKNALGHIFKIYFSSREWGKEKIDQGQTHPDGWTSEPEHLQTVSSSGVSQSSGVCNGQYLCHLWKELWWIDDIIKVWRYTRGAKSSSGWSCWLLTTESTNYKHGSIRTGPCSNARRWLVLSSHVCFNRVDVWRLYPYFWVGLSQ